MDDCGCSSSILKAAWLTVDLVEVEAQLADCLTALLGGFKGRMAVYFSLQLPENCVL